MEIVNLEFHIQLGANRQNIRATTLNNNVTTKWRQSFVR